MNADPDLSPRQQALLVFISGAGERELDPIRIMKGLFLIAMQTPRAWLPEDARYTFEPYHYGPYSPGIYSDLDELERKGYLATAQALGRNWKYYVLTPEGRDLARSIESAMDPRAVKYLTDMRRYVTELSFGQLLRAVYTKYPKYAVNSVFNG